VKHYFLDTDQEAMCRHGVCNCSLEACDLGLPRDPVYDYCGDCIKEMDAALDDRVLLEP